MATKGVRCSYEEIIDLHTESDKVTAIGIHTPTGDYPRKMFSGFFDMYKKYKYLGCSIKFVPVARLPADPLQVSYEAGETTIDPRDLANPLMFHGCHGNDMGTILNKLYGDDNSISSGVTGLEFDSEDFSSGDSVLYDMMERLYYKALTDRSWKKAGAQRGFVKSGLRPLVYSLATNRQIMPSSLIPNMAGLDAGENDDDMDFVGGDPTSGYSATGSTPNISVANGVTANNLQLFTPRLTSLGWMDTRNVITVPQTVTGVSSSDDVSKILNQMAINQINYAELPKIYMGVILMAPAYKTEQYYRMIIKHYFAFKTFRGISFRPEVTGVPTYQNANADLFGFESDGVTYPDLDGVDPNPDSPGDDNLGGNPYTLKNVFGTGYQFSGIDGTFDVYEGINFDGQDYTIASSKVGVSTNSNSANSTYATCLIVPQNQNGTTPIGIYIYGRSTGQYPNDRWVAWNGQVYKSTNGGTSFSTSIDSVSCTLSPAASFSADFGTSTVFVDVEVDNS